ncbi:unnamed protein product [Acanthoscelides obtectus]|uniref:Uncharacterized protein n=1 Tax=Acanthoscelides obtectus TaxID=200917 RepID=A0A9P0P1L3_ACAOB|nr:unnamed protein product [Acanthoscelides obtectus]CAK1663987.1 hypothetical protein AOBTE_LOCUS23985 [Acanthoscelides obtectus]
MRGVVVVFKTVYSKYNIHLSFHVTSFPCFLYYF